MIQQDLWHGDACGTVAINYNREVVTSIHRLKQQAPRETHPGINLNETLIALAISGATDLGAQPLGPDCPICACEVDLTRWPTLGDENGLKKLGLDIT